MLRRAMSASQTRASPTPRVFFLIRSLNRGGAERQLLELVGELAKKGSSITVCTFYDGGALRGELEAIAGVAVLSLGKRSRWDMTKFLWRLAKAVRHAKPDVIHGYMPVANELALLMAWLYRSGCIFGLRASNVDFSRYDRLARGVFAFGAICSRFADATIANSEAGREFHTRSGYDPSRMSVIHNGIDCERFRPDADARRIVRAEWGATAGERVVGVVARLDRMKDHLNFIEAAALVKKTHSAVRFICVGDGPPQYTEQLRSRAAKLGVMIQWVGARDDMPAVYNALDVVVLSSAYGEGFPNVVGEAMATGKPAVVTDVGDSATVVGETGLVVPPSDSAALADAIRNLLNLPPEGLRARSEATRTRIIVNFSKRQLVDSTEKVLFQVAARRGRKARRLEVPPLDQ